MASEAVKTPGKMTVAPQCELDDIHVETCSGQEFGSGIETAAR